MTRKNKTLQKLGTLAVLALLTASPPGLAQEVQWSQMGQESLTQADVQISRERARTALEKIPEQGEKDSVEARTRTALERRLSLLDELDALLLRREELSAAIAQNPTLLGELEAEIARLELADEPTQPLDPTVAGYEALVLSGSVLQAKVDEAQAGLDAAGRRLEKAAEFQGAAAQRLDEARHRQTALESQIAIIAGGSPTRDLLALQSANASLSARIAELERLALDEEGRGDGLLGEYRARHLAAAQLRLERHARGRRLYEESLQSVLEKNKAQSEADLAAREAEATTAEDPFARFAARWEVDTARSENSRADVEPFKVEVSAELSEQEKRLANDRRELDRLHSDVEESGTSGAVGRAIRRVFSQLRLRRKAVEYAVKPHYEPRAEEFTDRRFEIDQLLYELDERWRAETESSLGQEGLPPAEAAERMKTARRLRDSLRTSLQAERTALTEGINEVRKLRAVERDRSQVLDELEKFIHAKVFWIRDQSALTAQTLRKVPEEITRVAGWLRGLGSTNLRDLSLTSRPKILALFLVALGILPLISIGITRRTRRYLRGESASEVPLAWRSSRLGAAALLQCILPASCFVALAVLVPSLNLDREITSATSRLLFVLALAFLLKSVGRTFFGVTGLAARLSWMPIEASGAMRGLLRFLTVGILALLAPWSILSAEFLGIEVVPRLLMIAFGGLVGIASWRWFSGQSAVADFVVGDSSSSQTAKFRKGWTLFLALGVSAALVLSASGRGIAARAIGRSLVETVLTLIVLAVVYRVTVQLIERALAPAKRKKKKRSKDSEVKSEPTLSLSARIRQFRGVARTVLTLVGVWLIATYWGLNDQALGAMQTWHLYAAGVDPVEGTQLWVTASDLLYAVVVLLATVWLLRHLPGIYELTVFPRFNLDRGLRYAIVTISRYGLFFLGAMAALKALQIDFSSLAWLVAAMGIGLGFGLQEIVSNFVSGIILLVERPIRVGDMVTIGDVIGKIDRINIRATTVLNQDSQEVIVPNRSLIAQNVTNWTLASKVLRVIVHIGVAYGSDVNRVREILSNVASSDPEVLKEPQFQVLFMKHGDSSLDFEVRVFIDDPDKRFPVTDRLNTAINQSLAKAGIQIPFPQRDVHLYSASEKTRGD